MIRSFGKKDLRVSRKNIDVDDVILDAINPSKLDKSSLEGSFEKSISNKSLFFLFFTYIFFVSVFIFNSYKLQIINGETYAKISKENTLRKELIFAKRGVIKDRFGKVLASNGEEVDNGIHKRVYSDYKGLAHVLGYVKYPAKDKSGVFWRDKYVGVGGVEEYFNDVLNGKNGARLTEKDASGKVISNSQVISVKDGQDIKLSVDAELSDKLYKILRDYVKKTGFKGASSVIMDVRNGEVLAMVSYPEFDLNKFADRDSEYMQEVFKNKNKPLLNRAALGQYTPGSIVKPFMALIALKEKIISPEKKILSTGALRLENPYKPGTFSVFKDWKAHGWINMKEAIAHSSNVYFYTVGGGFKDQKGLGIRKIIKYAKLFGFGEKTGVELPAESSGLVPSPDWKKKIFGEDWYIGDTYHTSIGQYGFLLTSIQAARYISAVANYGKLLKPTLLKDGKTSFLDLKLKKDDVNVVHDGMRMSVRIGTARPINIPGISLAGKTGTAQTGEHNEWKNSWSVGFWPYDKPRFAFATVLEKAPAKETGSASHAMREFFLWLIKTHPEYAAGKYPESDLSHNSELENGTQD